MPHRKEPFLETATPHRNIAFLISPYSCTCSSDLLQHCKEIHNHRCERQQPISLCDCPACRSSLLRKSQGIDRHSNSSQDARQRMASRGTVRLFAYREDRNTVPSNLYARFRLVGSPSSSGTLFFDFESVTSKRRTAGRPQSSLAPTNLALLPLGFSKDFETFCGSLLTLGLARVLPRSYLVLTKSQSLHISSTLTVLRLFHVRSRQRGEDR